MEQSKTGRRKNPPIYFHSYNSLKKRDDNKIHIISDVTINPDGSLQENHQNFSKNANIWKSCQYLQPSKSEIKEANLYFQEFQEFVKTVQREDCSTVSDVIKQKDVIKERREPRANRFTAVQRLMLREEFRQSTRITSQRRKELSRDLNLTEKQVSSWFYNRNREIRIANMKENLANENNRQLASELRKVPVQPQFYQGQIIFFNGTNVCGQLDKKFPQIAVSTDGGKFDQNQKLQHPPICCQTTHTVPQHTFNNCQFNYCRNHPCYQNKSLICQHPGSSATTNVHQVADATLYNFYPNYAYYKNIDSTHHYPGSSTTTNVDQFNNASLGNVYPNYSSYHNIGLTHQYSSSNASTNSEEFSDLDEILSVLDNLV